MSWSETRFDPDAYAQLLGAAGGQAFGASLLSVVNRILPVSEIYGFETDAAHAPRSIVSVGADTEAESRVKAYTSRYHSADPLGPILRAPGAACTVQLRTVSAAEIRDPRYRYECYERPRFSGKLSIALANGPGWLVLSLYRPRAHTGLSPAVADRLRNLGAMALPLIAKHRALSDDIEAQPGGFVARLEVRLARAYPRLTVRERQVCARTLAGLTAEACALDLGVSASSVLTYRRRAYERLNVSSANQLLPALL